MILAKRYRIGEKRGSGRFGAVYQGCYIKTGEPVAIKMELSKETRLVKHETTLLKYLYDLGVRRIPFVFWYGVLQEHAFLVMTFYECSLYEKLGQLSLEESHRIIRQAISILQSIHQHQVVHRDIKPQNFMYRSGELFLIDFGLATFWIEGEPGSKGIVGTPKYTSFFLHLGDGYGRRDDLLSLGYLMVVLYGGVLPWCNHGGSPLKEEEYILLKSWEQWKLDMDYTVVYRFLDYCYHLAEEDAPHYHGMIELFI
jgi:serine/threonine protein kinase